MRRSGLSLTAVLLLAVVLPLAFASVASAAPAATVLAGGYWSNFLKFWANIFGSVSGIVFVALGVGAVSLLIITRGKWKK